MEPKGLARHFSMFNLDHRLKHYFSKISFIVIVVLN
jgi:hypothetical protein